MSNPVNVTRNDLGVMNGVHVWEVVDVDTGEVIGWDQQSVEDNDDASV